MRAFLLISGVILVLSGLCAFALMSLFPKEKLPAVRSLPSQLTFGDLVNIAVLFVSLFSLLIAVASVWVAIKSYRDAVEAASQQQALLDASRKALETVGSNSARQQALLEQSLKISEDQLRILREQWEKEQERRARRPRVEVALGNLGWEELQKHLIIPCQIRNQAENSATLAFTVRNIGNAPVLKGLVSISADPTSIIVEKHLFRIQIGENKHVYQTSTIDLLPYNETKSDYDFPVDVIIPREVREFSVSFRIHGENLPAQDILIRFQVAAP